LGQLVSMIATSISVVLIPVVTEARLRGDIAIIRRTAALFLRFGWLIGLAASVGLTVLAEPLNIMLFASSAVSEVWAFRACTAVFGGMQIISGTLLQALGAERAPVYYLLVAVAVKIALNLALTPLWGILGGAVAAVAAYATAAALNCIRLSRMLPARLAWQRDAAKPAAAAAVIAAGLG